MDDSERTLEALSKRLYTAVISDALDAVGAKGQIMAPRIRPVGAFEGVVLGRAATARAVAVDSRPDQPYATLLEALDSLQAGDFWIVATDGEGEVRSAIFGGLLATTAVAHGAVGCVIDGAVRDTRELHRLEFPTFATGFSPADSLGRDEVVEHGTPVRCGGVDVAPGDLVVADRDGVVVVPAELEDVVVSHALGKVKGEGNMKSELAAGLPVVDAFAKYGIL